MLKLHKSKMSNGWSLTELMITIAIVGIIAGIGTVSMIKYRSSIRANAALREMTSHMRIARAKAIRTNKNYLFRVYRNGAWPAPFDWYGYCEEGIITGGVTQCGGFMHAYQLPPGIEVPADNIPTAVYPPDAPFSPARGGINIQIENGRPLGSDGIRQFMFRPNGSTNFPVIMYMMPSEDMDENDPSRLRSITIHDVTGSVRAWKFTEGQWN